VAAAGAHYLKFLLDYYQGDLTKAVAAYNCGHVAFDEGRVGPETVGYRALVLEVLKARVVQPAAPLGQGCVEGNLRSMGDSWTLNARISHRGSFTLEFLPLDKGGKVAGKPYGLLMVGDTDKAKDAKAAWTDSNPKIVMTIPKGAAVLVRCTNSTQGCAGEARLSLDGVWKTFAFKMEPKA
jgi:hypothetical protein